ncbi:MAG: DUF2334 domain-containing protein [Butyrivibrio sp.]|nr:DUF2334 domain-containing protein [Butyrivibrio sp.]
MSDYKYLLRFDDICPTMDWNQWNRAVELLDRYGIKPLIGVIPSCADPKLNINPERSDFWQYIKMLQEKGYTVAMHGFEHVYRTKNKGIVGVSKQSEFAGLSYEKQYKMLEEGKKILHENGVDTDIFFAPSHSYDRNTLKALNELGFQWISDGKGLKADYYKGLRLLPCINHAMPKKRLGKYITVVCHANEWTKKDGFDELDVFCKEHQKEIVDFVTFKQQPVGNHIFNFVVEKMVVGYQRYIKKYR